VRKPDNIGLLGKMHWGESMKKIEHSLGEYYAGKNAIAGVLVFDQAVQHDLSDIWVRFYALAKNDWLLFLKEKANLESFWIPLDAEEYAAAGEA
jgi:hypothetical protein